MPSLFGKDKKDCVRRVLAGAADTTIFSVITGNSLILGSGIMTYVYFAGMVHAIFYKIRLLSGSPVLVSSV